MMSMLRTILEITLVLGLIFGAFYVNKTLAKESRENKARAKDRISEDNSAST